MINGRLTSAEAVNSIYHLELITVFKVLRALYASCLGSHMEIQSDNTSVFSYINEFGGMPSQAMDQLARQLWNWCKRIVVSAVYIPSCENAADFCAEISRIPLSGC